MDIVSPGSWLLPRPYDAYPLGSIPSIRRNSIIAACFDVANLMERGGTGFQTMADSYAGSPDNLQPVVMSYPGFLDLRLFDRLYENPDMTEDEKEELTDQEKVLAFLRTEGPQQVKELQKVTRFKSRAQFLREVLNPLLESGAVYRDGSPKSPQARIHLRT